MTHPKSIRPSLWLVVVLASALAVALPVVAQSPEIPAPEAVAEVPPETDITARSEQAIRALGEIRGQLDDLPKIESARARLQELQTRYRELLPEGSTFESAVAGDAEYDIDTLLTMALALSEQASDVTEELSAQAEPLEDTLQRVRAYSGEWGATLADASGLAPALEQRIIGMLQTAQDLDELVAGRLNDVVDAQNQALNLLEALTPLTTHAQDLAPTGNLIEGGSDGQQLTEFSQPPLWRLSADILSISTRDSSHGFVARLGRDAKSFLALNGSQIVIHIILLVMLLGLLQVLKRNIPAGEESSAVLKRPLVAGILVWLLFSLALYSWMPATILTVIVLATAILALTVLVTLIPAKMRTAIYVFVAIFLADRLLAEFPAGDALPRVLNVALGAAMVTLAYFGARPYAIEQMATWGVSRAIVRAAVVITAALCAAGLILNVLGNANLSTLLVRGAIRSAGTFLILFTSLTIVTDLVGLTLGLQAMRRLRSITNNRYRIVATLRGRRGGLVRCRNWKP